MITPLRPLALITRPMPEAAILANHLATLGYSSIIEPMFTLESLPNALVSLETMLDAPIQAMLFTSRNAVLAAKRITRLHTIPALCVGDSTADFARQCGFTRVTSAGGDIYNLESLAKRVCAPERGKLLYLTGTHIAGNLQENLAANGFTVERYSIYDTKPVAALSTELQNALKQRHLALALFYSPRTAQIFEQRIIEAGLASITSSISLFCLSKSIASAFSHLKWLSIHYPSAPNTKSLLELVQKFQFNP